MDYKQNRPLQLKRPVLLLSKINASLRQYVPYNIVAKNKYH